MSSPLAAHFSQSATQCPINVIDKGLMSFVSYESAELGDLMHLMVCTQPDIAYTIGKVSRYMSNPGKVH
jgi:hypothetical protein